MANEIATYDEELAKYAQAATAQERPKAGSISLKNGQITYGGQPVPNNKLACVVLASAWENAYYSKPYDPMNIVTPDCYALGRAEGDEEIVMVPAANAKNRQGSADGLCKGCPKMEWKSDPTPGRKGKACKEKRRLVVIPVSALNSEEELGNAEVALITIPVMSVANWAAYVSKVGTSLKRPPWGVITEITTQPDPRSQFRVLFNCASKVSFDGDGGFRFAGLKAKLEQALPMLLQGYDDEPAEELPASQTAPKSKKF
jgi:hypothetical protein